MTEQQRKLLRKNAEFGYDETENVTANEISKTVHNGYATDAKSDMHKGYTTDAECAILRKTVYALLCLLKGECDEQSVAPILEEFNEYSRYVEEIKMRVKEDIGGAV